MRERKRAEEKKSRLGKEDHLATYTGPVAVSEYYMYVQCIYIRPPGICAIHPL